MIADGARQKRVVALVDPQAASAAYWLATQASELVVTPSGQAGSIGCYMVHFDHSGQLENDGIEVTVIRAGENKGEGNPYEPLDAEAAEHLQTLVDVYESTFVEAVARGRNVSAETVRESFGQGRVFDAERLVTLGMVDRVATYEEVLGELRSSDRRPESMAAAIPDDTRIAAWIQAQEERSPSITPLVEDAVKRLTTTIRLDGTQTKAPDAVRERTAPDDTPAPANPAPSGQEEPMSQTDTAAPTKGSDGDEAVRAALKKDRERRRQIREVCKAHDIDRDQAEQWADEGLTIEEVNASILKQLQQSVKNTPTPRATVVPGDVRAEDDPAWGFKSHLDFLTSVIKAGQRRASSRDQVRDERLRPLVVSDENDRGAAGEMAFLLPRAFTPHGINAAAGSDEQGGYQDRYGGFAVPQTTAPGMLQIGMEDDPTAGRTQPVPMTSPKVSFNARTDKDHSSSVSGGFTVTRRPETVAGDSSRMEMEQVVLSATSLFGLAYATEEILVDSPISFAALIRSGFEDQFAFHMLDEKIRGGGGNEFLGVLNSPAKVEVAKEGSQAADTIVGENVIKMRARCWGYQNAIWIANHDAFVQLIQAHIVKEGSAGGGLILVYKQSMEEDRPDMLLGRPIFYSEHASTVGDVGDLMLVNWSQYLEGLYQPLQSAESVHVRFENHERAFKFWLRNAGAPWWRSALTPNQSSETLSPIVTLAERA